MDEKKRNAEELLDCAMAIGEGLLVSGAEVSRVEHLNQLSRKICNEKKSLSAKEIQAELQTMEEEKEDSFRKDAILYGVISSSFSVFFGGSFLDAIASFLIGILLKCLQTCFALWKRYCWQGSLSLLLYYHL